MELNEILKSIKITEKLFIKEQINFPIEIFPDDLKVVIDNLIEYKRFNVDFISSAILSACSLAIGNKAILKHNNYTNKCIFWTFVVGYSGINKTQPINWALAPFIKQDSISYKDYKHDLMIYDEQKDMSKKDLLALGITDAPKQAPKYKKTVLNIFTPESLTPLHEINKNGLIINADEMTGFLESFNQYRKGGDQEFYITLWNGDSAATDRVSKNLLLENPFVNIIGGIQYTKLKLLYSAHRSADGFIYRFLPTVPTIEHEEYPNENEMPELVQTYYNNFIANLINLQVYVNNESEHGYNRLYTLNKEAKTKFREYIHSITDLKNKAIKEKNDTLQGILSKMTIYFYRFSLLLQIINDCHDGLADNYTIFDYSVIAAQKLTEYYIAMHQRLDKITGESSVDETGKQVLNDKVVGKYLKDIKKASHTDIANVLKLTNNKSSVTNLLK